MFLRVIYTWAIIEIQIPKVERCHASDHTEETSSGSTTTHVDYSLPKYDSFPFEIEPDQGELTSIVMEDIDWENLEFILQKKAVILGMDWLASHRATIDCYARTVIFGNVRQPEFLYHGSSPLKSSPNIEKLSVVCEFADVFPDELPGLPPVREIEFGIELIPGAEPISKASYRMAPVELKELKE
nr:hypothetical protein [Tanacetum cinerariifolium]